MNTSSPLQSCAGSATCWCCKWSRMDVYDQLLFAATLWTSSYTGVVGLAPGTGYTEPLNRTRAAELLDIRMLRFHLSADTGEILVTGRSMLRWIITTKFAHRSLLQLHAWSLWCKNIFSSKTLGFFKVPSHL